MNFLTLTCIVIMTIPLAVLCWYALAPIKWDRIIVGERFSLIILGYILFALLTINISAYVVELSNPYIGKNSTLVDSVRTMAWSHLVTQSSTKSYPCYQQSNMLLDILGIFLCNVLLITTMVNGLAKRQSKWKEGHIYYSRALYGCERHRKKVIAILGNHESLVDITRQCLERNTENPDYILIQVKEDIEGVRNRLQSVLSSKQLEKVVVCQGELTSQMDLSKLHLYKASEVFIIGNQISVDSKYSVHDADCMKCLQILRGFDSIPGLITIDNRPERDSLLCRVFFEYQTSYSALQISDTEFKSCWEIPDEHNAQKRKQQPAVIFEPLNFYELSCEKVLVSECNKEDSPYLPLDGREGIGKDSDKYVHLFIVGQTKIGTALALEAAQIAHYPNFFKEDKDGNRVGPKTRITFIDIHADTEMDFFTGRLRHLFDVSHRTFIDLSQENKMYSILQCHKQSYKEFDPLNEKNGKYAGGYLGKDFIDVDWEFIKGDIASASVKAYLLKECSDSNALCTVAICLPNQNQSIATALYLPSEVYENVQQVLVYQRYDASVLNEINHSRQRSYYDKIKPFGCITDFYDGEYCGKIESLFRDELFFYPSEGSTNGKSQITRWWSMRYRYNIWWTKMRSIGYHGGEDTLQIIDDNTEFIGKVEHNRWNIEQLIQGFRPLTEAEQRYVMETTNISGIGDDSCSKVDKCSFGERKNELKLYNKAHLDICSSDRLNEIDPGVVKYDSPDENNEIHRREMKCK